METPITNEGGDLKDDASFFLDTETEQTEQKSYLADDAWVEKALAMTRVWSFIHSEAVGEERQEQERTKEAKERFLKVYAKTMGTITLACDQAEIGRTQFYQWMKTDLQFRSAVNKANDDRVDMVEDRLLKLIQQDDGPSIRFFLQAKNPEYKNKSQVEVVKGHRTFEDILIEQAKKNREARLAKEKDGK